MSIKAYRIKINGIVQGVGFRPHVYRLAMEFGLKGWVLNSPAGVSLEVEGEETPLGDFLDRLQKEPPPMALIRSYDIQEISPAGFRDFTIKPSDDAGEIKVMISPDIAVCGECRREVSDPKDRRFGYPFTNCTNCGPRFTIIKDLPYDRAMTAMASFSMCRECQAEFNDPSQRRFHAQPNACPVCGPHIRLVDGQGQVAREGACELLKAGKIIAVKGLGGFHLAVNALDAEAVRRLRRGKRRDAKPFAVMASDVDTARKYCFADAEEENLLKSPQAPIVVLERNDGPSLSMEAVHPGINTLGVMLPYTPLHYLLFDQELKMLVMTSANISDEPLIIDNDEAVKQLGEVADYFLLHDRDIYNPCDDSVLQLTKLKTVHFFRRARGFVPGSIRLGTEAEPVLALGGDMKNTFCITREGEAFLSQHWGDLNHYHNYVYFQQGIELFKKALKVEPQVLAHDLHPEYQASRWAKQQKDVKRIEIQHHHAHLAAVMAENQLQGQVLGLICDGSGWGSDGTLWGGEILRGDYRQFTRLGHLKNVPLPGGDISARRPYRMALVYLFSALGEAGLAWADQGLLHLSREEKELLVNKIGPHSKEPLTSSCGRLFDAVGAVLGICGVNNYEGQAAAELEAVADQNEKGSYGFQVYRDDHHLLMDVMPMWPELIADMGKDRSTASMAQKFHLTLVKMYTEALGRIREETGLNRVVLSGGVFHNQILLTNLIKGLTERDFLVYHHQKIPPGDGGISLGQAAIASEVVTKCV
ncbi:MAG: carbamoyltransferase HypF [Syntrophomonadaceae bacterium]|nr:carbamoyltransferase HypF [Syntrophomonadaceae bacterium]